MSQRRPDDGKEKESKKERSKSASGASTSTGAKKKDGKSKRRYYTPPSSTETLKPAGLSPRNSGDSVYQSLESESEIDQTKAKEVPTELPIVVEPSVFSLSKTPTLSPVLSEQRIPEDDPQQIPEHAEESEQPELPELPQRSVLFTTSSRSVKVIEPEQPQRSDLITDSARSVRVVENELPTYPDLITDSARSVKTVASSAIDSDLGSKKSAVSIKTPERHPSDESTLSSDSEHILHRPHKSFGDGKPTNLEKGDAFIYMVIPPDGGFGWIIMVISFLCQVIVDGIIFGVGIILPEMARDFGVEQSTIVLVASIQIGSISSAFINSYGFRPVALVGTVGSCVSIFIASHSTNITALIFFYSIIGGPTLSMIWVSSQLIIGYYFERYRPIANGLSCSGAGAGIMVFCTLNSELVPIIGWRNMTRIHVAILSTVLIMAMTFIEVAPTQVGTITEPDLDTDDTDWSEQLDQIRSVRYSRVFSVKSFGNESVYEHMFEDYEEPNRSAKPNIFVRLFEKCCPAWKRRRERRVTERSHVAPSSRATFSYVIRPTLMEKQDLFYMGPTDYDRRNDDVITEMTDGRNIELHAGRAKSVNYTLSVLEAQGRPSLLSMRRSTARRGSRLSLRQNLAPINWVPLKILMAFGKLFDLNLLRTMEFRVLIASAFFYPMGFNIPFLYSKARAEIDMFHATMIAPVIGLSNFIFRIASGFMGQRYKQYTTYICGGGIFFGGTFVFVSGFYGEDKIWFQYVYAFCYGIAPAFYSTLRAIIYVRSLGLENLTNAFGLTAMAMGLGVFVGTTCAGYMNEYSGGYSVSFKFAGINLMIAGGLKLILPSLIIWKDRRLAKSNMISK